MEYCISTLSADQDNWVSFVTPSTKRATSFPKIKIELDDLALRYLEPNVNKELEEKIAMTSEARQKFIDDIIAEIKTHMEHAEIRCEVNGRVKHFFSIYKKMLNQHKTLDQIYDIFAVRIIVDSVKDCYAALGNLFFQFFVYIWLEIP